MVTRLYDDTLRRQGAVTILAELLDFDGIEINTEKGYAKRQDGKWLKEVIRCLLNNQDILERVMIYGFDNIVFDLDDKCKKITGVRIKT